MSSSAALGGNKYRWRNTPNLALGCERTTESQEGRREFLTDATPSNRGTSLMSHHFFKTCRELDYLSSSPSAYSLNAHTQNARYFGLRTLARCSSTIIAEINVISSHGVASTAATKHAFCLCSLLLTFKLLLSPWLSVLLSLLLFRFLHAAYLHSNLSPGN